VAATDNGGGGVVVAVMGCGKAEAEAEAEAEVVPQAVLTIVAAGPARPEMQNDKKVANVYTCVHPLNCSGSDEIQSCCIWLYTGVRLCKFISTDHGGREWPKHHRPRIRVYTTPSPEQTVLTQAETRPRAFLVFHQDKLSSSCAF
jgi:hypothetical protein